jgi:type I restriction-modification system DNA methylase subunit
LIGRIIFCWFLKVKRSDQKIPLIPDSLLSSEAARRNKNYYHGVLEPLFFQVLNRRAEERISDLPEVADSIPFLNGGLFEPQKQEDFYDPDSITGNFANYALKIPDDWFTALFEKLEQYNFTIDENSPTEIEVSVDPEMLGRIFENLLAEIDPDSGESARKSTGSFYTPREIVNYMVDESLILYLKGKLNGGDGIRGADDDMERLLRKLFSYRDPENPFKRSQSRQLIDAIDQCKILDPACGSGAFPMGVLQRLVHLLGKLDPENQYWKEKQLEKLDDLIESARTIDDPKVRKKVVSDLNKRRKDINSDFAKKELDYGRKLFLIENCIHGVDIQPIAAEISKLRCFLTLIVDDSVDDKEPNRGVNPLPNLEFKFVTADALLALPASGLFNSDEQLKKLEAVRHEYINSYGATKENAKRNFQEIQDEIFDVQIKNFNENQDRRAVALSIWKPFSHEKVDWFDSQWMFGVKAFDIVIGNPPYLFVTQLSEGQKKEYSSKFYTYSYRYDVYGLFIERSCTDLLNPAGVLSFIIPHTLLNNDSFEKLRKFLLDRTSIRALIDLGGGVFGSAKNETMMLFARAARSVSAEESYIVKSDKNLRGIKEGTRVSQDNFYRSPKFTFLLSVDKNSASLLERLRCIPRTLGDICTVNQGLRTGDNIKYLSETKRLPAHKPAVGGRNIARYIAKPVFFVQYEPTKLDAPRNESIFTSSEKLIVQEIRNISLKDRIIACYDDNQLYCLQSTNVINLRNRETENLKFLLGLLNSSTLNWFFRASFPSNNHIASNQLAQLPIPVADDWRKHCLKNVVDYIILLKKLDEVETVSEFVSNDHVIQQFEEVIDALVYELYFEEDFQQADTTFYKYVARDFASIEGLSKKDKITTIEAAFQKLREKDNEIRNNLKLMDIRLADLIGPIKNVR